MQRVALKERSPSLQNVPTLGLRRKQKSMESCPQTKDLVLASLLSGEAAGSHRTVPATLPDTVSGSHTGNSGGKGENSVPDKTHTSPRTPLKTLKQASKPGTPPLTPLANLKVLIAAASTAREKECKDETQGGMSESTGQLKCEEHKGGKEVEDGGGRKMKSLAILCKKFLSIADSEIGVRTDFSLESMCKKLGTNRRRIYDIINVLEALEMIVKQSKNWYTWLGQENLLVTLAKMRAMAEDDVDFRNLLRTSSTELTKENQAPLPSPSLPPTSTGVGVAGFEGVCKLEDPPYSGEEGCSTQGGGGRWDKSLGVLCQKFIMLFLVIPDNELTLDFAGNILMPDDGGFSPHPTNSKTKVRRLYDIANVLTTLGLIRKKTFLAPNHRKMPGYSWVGPSLNKIKEISVCRKNELTLYPFYPKKGSGVGGVALTRKPSFGSMRPFLHQYEVKGHVRSSSCGPNSAPSSPTKSKGSGFKRSLSFGAGVCSRKIPLKATPFPPAHSSLTTPTPHVVEGVALEEGVAATPLSQVQNSASSKLSSVQMDFLQEVKEFEAEIQKLAHKYPRVAPLVSKFLMNQAGEGGVSQAEAMPTTATPAQLCSPPLTLSPHKLTPAPATFLFPDSSHSGPVVGGGLSLGGVALPLGMGSSTPSGGGVSPPPNTTNSSVTPPQSAMPTFPKLETLGSHAHCVLNAARQVQIGGVTSVGHTHFANTPTETNSFNPNSLLVGAAANTGFSIFPRGGPSPPFLPLYPLTTPPLSAAGVKLSGVGVRCLAPKPTPPAPGPSEEMSRGDSTGKEDYVSPSKRRCLEDAPTRH